MVLTTAQYAALKADIAASADMNNQPATHAGSEIIAGLYNVVSATDVWRTEASVQAIYDAIDWSKYTPADTPDTTQIYENRILCIQTKQMNLQNMLQGRTSVDASKANLRAGLRDAVTALPAGAAGAAVTAGGANGNTVLSAMTRKATRFEKLFATSQAQTGGVTANLLVLEGAVSVDDIQIARES